MLMEKPIEYSLIEWSDSHIYSEQEFKELLEKSIDSFMKYNWEILSKNKAPSDDAEKSG